MTGKDLSLKNMKICVTEEELKHGDVFYLGQNNKHNKNSYLTARYDKQASKSMNDLLDIERTRIINAINHKEKKFLQNQLRKKSPHPGRTPISEAQLIAQKNVSNALERVTNQSATYETNRSQNEELPRQRKAGILGQHPVIMLDNQAIHCVEVNDCVANGNNTVKSNRVRKRSISCCNLYELSKVVDEVNRPSSHIPLVVLSPSDSDDSVYSGSDDIDWDDDAIDYEIAKACGLEYEQSEDQLTSFENPPQRKISLSHSDIDRYGESLHFDTHDGVKAPQEQDENMKAFTELRDRFRQIRLTIQAQRGCSVSSSSSNLSSWASSPQLAKGPLHINNSNSPQKPGHLPSLGSNCKLSKCQNLEKGSLSSLNSSTNVSPTELKSKSKANKAKKLKSLPKEKSFNKNYSNLLSEDEKYYMEKRARQKALLSQKSKNKKLDPLNDVRFTNLVNSL